MLDRSIMEALQSIVGDQHVLTHKVDRVTYSFDATADVPRRIPEVVVMPRSSAEVQGILKLAQSQQVAYFLTHPETSAKIAERKATDAAATGASTVATGCPACMMQLLDSTYRFGSGQRIRHYISLLAEAYRAERLAQACACLQEADAA